jgi:hypothetical protein
LKGQIPVPVEFIGIARTADRSETIAETEFGPLYVHPSVNKVRC